MGGAGTGSVITPPPAGGAGAGGMPAGGTGGMEAAGTGGMEAAGTGGTAGMAGAGGSTAPAGAFAPRGPEPTEQSANGMAKGPYTVESMTSGYKDGTFDDATIWYPTDADAPFGCVSVVPGFLSPQSSIRNWGPFLASHGIVTITIGVPGGDQPNVRATKLMSALDTCVAENTRASSPLMGKISEAHLGVSGWSMGGGGTLIAASANPELKAAVSFAAWGPSGGASNKVPVLMFEATADGLAAGMSDGYYRAVPETVPKMLFEVSGSSHNVANDPANHSGTIGLYGLSWWKVFLEGDERYRKFLTAPAPSIVTSKFDHNLM
jgi:dienelactone hydrolase